MIDRPEYDLSEYLSKKFFGLVNISNARKHAEREKEIYYKKKGKNKARR
jgi:hypothetical protein